MLGRFINLFKQDITVAFRNGFLYLVLFLSALIIIVLNFAVPKEVKVTPKEMFLDLTESRVFEEFLISSDVDKGRIFKDRKGLYDELKRNKNALGIIMEGSLDKAKFTVIHQGTESVKILNILDATIEGTLRAMRKEALSQDYIVRNLRDKASSIPFNKKLVPFMMVFEVVMFGFIVIAVMVFQEKQDGSIRAFRVTPAGTLEYILSKSLVNVLMGLVYGFLIVVSTVGLNAGYGPLFLIIVLTSLLMTLVGLTISVFFSNISEFLFAGIAVLALFSLPSVSYLYPSYAPTFLRMIPSYPTVFGVREILFSTGKEGFMAPMLLTLAVECSVFLILSYSLVNKKLMKEGR